MPTDKEFAKAKRLARAIASDISVYNVEKIERGIQNDTLFEDLGAELQKGFDHFQERVPHEIVNNTNILESAIVDIIVASRGHVSSKIF